MNQDRNFVNGEKIAKKLSELTGNESVTTIENDNVIVRSAIDTQENIFGLQTALRDEVSKNYKEAIQQSTTGLFVFVPDEEGFVEEIINVDSETVLERAKEVVKIEEQKAKLVGIIKKITGDDNLKFQNTEAKIPIQLKLTISEGRLIDIKEKLDLLLGTAAKNQNARLQQKRKDQNLFIKAFMSLEYERNQRTFVIRNGADSVIDHVFNINFVEKIHSDKKFSRDKILNIDIASDVIENAVQELEKNPDLYKISASRGRST